MAFVVNLPPMNKLLLPLLLACPLVCVGQPVSTVTITGYVMDEAGDMLPGALVRDAEGRSGAVADAEGFFALDAPLGTQALRAECVGHQPLDHALEGEAGDVQILVMRSSTRLGEVVVAGSGLGTMKDWEGAINMERISSQALTRAACCNLSESFEANPSVDVAYSDAVTGAKQIQLLGLAGTYAQMLTENYPNQRGAAAPYGLDYVPGPWMQSIQVSKGAASVRNGFESVTGQINVEYKKPPVAAPLLLNLFASDAGRYEANAVGALRLSDRLSTALFANAYSEQEAHDGDGDSFLDVPKMRELCLMNRWHYQTPGFVSQSGVKWLTDLRRSGQDTHAHADAPYTIRNEANRLELFSKNGLVLNDERAESVALIASGTYHQQRTRYHLRSYNVYETSAYGALLFETTFTPAHKLAAGANYQFDQYAERGSEGQGDTQEHTIGSYMEYTFHPGDRLTLMAGLRGDWSSRFHWFVTPRLHAQVAPTGWLSLRASAGIGYRTPVIMPTSHYLLASSRTICFDEPLRQEKAWNYGISAAMRLPLAGETLELNAEWFRTDFSNQAVIDLDQDAHAVHIYNLDGKSTASVAQVDASYPLARGLTLLAAYRWMDVRCTYGGRTLRKPLTSRYKALFTANYQTPMRRWQLDLTLQLNGPGRLPTPDPDNPLWDTGFHAYERVNAQVTRRFRRMDIYIGGENLTDFRQDNPIIAADDPTGPDFDATLVWGPTMGRRLYIGIRYTIPQK